MNEAYLLVFLLVIIQTLCLHHKISPELQQILESVEVNHANGPDSMQFWSNLTNIETFGDLKDVSGDETSMIPFRNFSVHYDMTLPDKGGLDYEAVFAVENFFWGKTNGIVLELGAVDGVIMSQSLAMEETLGWHRILIEGDPTHKQGLSKHINSLAYSCAICESAQTVHYIGGSRTSGIIEFMSDSFMKRFHNDIRRIPRDEWTNRTEAKAIQCIPLKSILEYRRINHVNFLVLDVEGGEMEVLRSIDYSRVRFDVMVVETERKFRPVGYANEVKSFLSHQGYRFLPIGKKSRNSWFVHQFYIPSVKS